MQKDRKRLFLWGLCFILFITMMPPVQVFATEQESQELIKLGTPTDLTWNCMYSEVTESEWRKDDVVGMMSWKTTAPDLGMVRIQIFKEGESEPFISRDMRVGKTGDEWRSIDIISGADPEDGNYYFTITSLGDGITYSDSDTAKSDIWTYVKPQEQVKSCTNPKWDWPYMIWENPIDRRNIENYQIRTFYAQTAEEEPSLHLEYGISRSGTVVEMQGTKDPGYYYFQVRSLSCDITKWCNGEWTELVGPFVVDDSFEYIDVELEDIIDKADTADEIKEAIQKIEPNRLKNAMNSDIFNQKVVAKIKTLEDKVGGAAVVEVVNSVSGLDASNISVIGANLNNAVSGDKPIKLLIDAPKEEICIPDEYEQSSAIGFSMVLDNVEHSDKLEVPVKVAIPWPNNMSTDMAVILQFHQDKDEPEVIHPWLDTKNGTYYANFTVTGFSDFCIVQLESEDAFDTFDELKKIVSQEYDGYTFKRYNGVAPLVIEEDITIPTNLVLDFKQIEIPKDVKMTIATDAAMQAQGMTVDGSMEVCENASCTVVSGDFIINGNVKVATVLNLTAGVELKGADNIEYAPNAVLLWRYDINDMISFKEAIDDAKAGEVEANWEYNFNVIGADDGSIMCIDESVSIPDKTYVNIKTPISVNEECSLAACTNLYVASSLVVEGTLISTENITINPADGGKIKVVNAGKYEGDGTIRIYRNGIVDYSQVLEGIDLDSFEVFERNEGPGYWQQYWELIKKLGTPTNLEWDSLYYENEESEWVKNIVPGMMSWKTASPDLGTVRIQVFKEGEAEPLILRDMWVGRPDDEWRSIDVISATDPENGNYYFTITSLGDNVKYCDSNTAKSGMWEYTKPDASVEFCSNPKWNWPYVTWNKPVNLSNVENYQIRVYYAPTEDSEYEVRDYFINSSASKYEIPGTRECGYYYFQVRSLSYDISEWNNSEWTEMAGPYVYTPDSKDVENDLAEIMDNAETIEDIKEAVQEIDTEKLREAMEADQSNTGAVEMLKALEEKVGGSAEVNVADVMEALDESKISIVGANLNNAVSQDEKIKLIIDESSKMNEIPRAYDIASAVRFSMTLSNVENAKELKVPVKISFAVPEGLDIESFVVLHYHSANECEVIKPHLYQKDGQNYADIVLTGFSDFILTQDVRNPFSDVSEDMWYYPYVKKAYLNNLMSGVSVNPETGLITFAPEMLMTRAQFVQVLYSMEGKPEVAYSARFTDVPNPEEDKSAWYSYAVLWAAEQGITSGQPDGSFGVDNLITREQMAVMLMQYAKASGADVSARADLNDFVDYASVSSWAVESLKWAVANGIMSGEAGGKLNPQGQASRAVGATMLNAFYDKFK